VELTERGRAALGEERRRRDGWLAEAIADLSPEEQAVLRKAAGSLRQIAES
jgi:DNA-binding MarR family transcriptional regulator